MKKAIFTVLVVLVALLVVTCDSAVSTMGIASNSTIPTRDEPGFVTLNIKVSDNSRARALDATVGAADANFYEVVFESPRGTFFRQTWDATTTTTGDGHNAFQITVAVGDYDNSGATGKGTAVMFAGKKETSDKTLLGVGKITATVDGDTNPATVISDETTSVTFTISPLISKVTNAASTSSFLITGPTTPLPGYATPSTIPELTISSVAYPMFAVPKNTTGVSATWKITGTDTEYIEIVAGATGTSTAVVNPDEASETGTTVTTIAFGNAAASTLLNALTTGFTITFNTPNVDEYSSLAITVPVKMIYADDASEPNSTAIGGASPTPVAAVTDWVLRGGSDNTMLDTGLAGGKGGRVLLMVGTPTVVEDVTDITVTSTW